MAVSPKPIEPSERELLAAARRCLEIIARQEGDPMAYPAVAANGLKSLDRADNGAKRLREALGLAEQALTVAVSTMSASADHVLYNRALRAARNALKQGRDSDGSPEGGDAEGGSVRSTTARPEGIAQ